LGAGPAGFVTTVGQHAQHCQLGIDLHLNQVRGAQPNHGHRVRIGAPAAPTLPSDALTTLLLLASPAATALGLFATGGSREARRASAGLDVLAGDA